jgi:DNA-binding NarL/FixJ family response regulator
MDTRMGSPVHQSHTLVAQVIHGRRTGVGPQALEELAGRVRHLAEPLGLRRVLRLLGGSAPAAAPRGRGGLTSRETEVLRLLGEGLLNREIAQRLVISENTAANHVRSILGKTGSGNRTQAAMYAAAHGLLG